ncbi:hypothetical protein QUF72_06085 [Desulfobacterales bacterium HSG2]|nr:hypothetical protein [Desulfobacterales bacterium HSG2]
MKLPFFLGVTFFKEDISTRTAVSIPSTKKVIKATPEDDAYQTSTLFKSVFSGSKIKDLEQFYSDLKNSYSDLNDLFHKKCKTAMIDQRPYWNAMNAFAKMVFENLEFLYLQLREPSDHNIYSHLPTFMSTLIMGSTIAEYLKRMMYIIQLTNRVLVAEDFGNLFEPEIRRESERRADNFLDEINQYPGCENIRDEWKKFSEAAKIRDAYTHAFRLPWWPREGNPLVYGFPETLYSDPNNKIKDEIWKFVKNPGAWEKEISSDKNFKNNFISGADLVYKMLLDGIKVANTLFLSFKEYINQQRR